MSCQTEGKAAARLNTTVQLDEAWKCFIKLAGI